MRKLRELRPPAADAEAVGRWLADDAKVQSAVRDLIAGAERRDYASVDAAASRAQLAGNESRQAASALGMQVCGTFAASGR